MGSFWCLYIFSNRGRYPISIKSLTEIQRFQKDRQNIESLQKVQKLPSLLNYLALILQAPNIMFQMTQKTEHPEVSSKPQKTSQQLQTKVAICHSNQRTSQASDTPFFISFFLACIVVVVVLQPIGPLGLLLLAHQLCRNLQHSVNTLDQFLLVNSHIETCPITHEHTSIANNSSRVLDIFPFKTSFVAAFPKQPNKQQQCQMCEFFCHLVAMSHTRPNIVPQLGILTAPKLLAIIAHTAFAILH